MSAFNAYICPVCRQMVTCSCQQGTAADGTVMHSRCVSAYNNNLSNQVPPTSTTELVWNGSAFVKKGS